MKAEGLSVSGDMVGVKPMIEQFSRSVGNALYFSALHVLTASRMAGTQAAVLIALEY